MTTAFVAGATGYTGREVVRQLAASGVRTIAHVRPDSPSLPEWRERFARMGAEVDATAWQPSAMEAALRRHQPDAVFALLGTTRAKARAAEGADYEAVDYGMTSMLLHAVQATSPAARFVYLSSIGARSDTGNEYLAARGRIESELQSSGLSHVIVRPAIISGPDRGERRVMERVFAVGGDAVLRALAVVGASSLHARYRSMSAERLARALIRGSLDPIVATNVLEGETLQQWGDAG